MNAIETLKLYITKDVDCFAALAMTKWGFLEAAIITAVLQVIQQIARFARQLGRFLLLSLKPGSPQ